MKTFQVKFEGFSSYILASRFSVTPEGAFFYKTYINDGKVVTETVAYVRNPEVICEVTEKGES